MAMHAAGKDASHSDSHDPSLSIDARPSNSSMQLPAKSPLFNELKSLAPTRLGVRPIASASQQLGVHGGSQCSRKAHRVPNRMIKHGAMDGKLHPSARCGHLHLPYPCTNPCLIIPGITLGRTGAGMGARGNARQAAQKTAENEGGSPGLSNWLQDG
jgi:hypothetical protein